MAVYTHIDETSLHAFLREYDLGDLLAHDGIEQGVENSNYWLQTDLGRFILTIYEKRVDPADLPFFLGLMQHLAQHGLPCPQPVQGRDGAILREAAGKPASIVTFLAGHSVRRPSADHARAAGEALASLHLAAGGFTIRRANALSVAGWRDLTQRTAARADEVEAGLAGEIAAEFTRLEAVWPHGLPAGVIHADLFPDNVFFADGQAIGAPARVSGVIDFYFACNDLLAYDLAICLNAWCFERDGSLNVTKARALTQGYTARRPLSAAEVAALPLLARGSALRFLLTRLYDWLNRVPGARVQPHDPREYLKKLRFHRSIESAAAYGLD